jgi:hypothetical protein
MRKKVLCRLCLAVELLSPDHRQAAVTLLLAADIPELAVACMTTAGPSVDDFLVELLLMFCNVPQARERLMSKEVVDKVIRWSATWLSKVCNVLSHWGNCK